MSDEVVLTLPHERAFHDVAHLVVGGLAVRLNLTIESLEDLQIALDGLLPHVSHGAATVTVRILEGSVEVAVGPFVCHALRAQLEEGEGVGLARVLKTVSDGFDVREEGGSCWVALTKTVAPPERRS